MSRSPTLAEVIRRAIDARAADLHVALPGKIVKYDRNYRRANVQPLIRNEYVDEDGNVQNESFPVIPDVPVMFPGAGEWSVTFPVNVGDTVLLVFCDVSIDTWLARGGEADPLTGARHSLSDAVCYPGLRPFDAAHITPGEHMSLGKTDTVTRPVAMAHKVEDELAELATVLRAFALTPITDAATLLTAVKALQEAVVTLIGPNPGPNQWPQGVGSDTVLVSG